MLANVVAIVAKHHGRVVDRVVVRRVTLVDRRHDHHVVLLGHLERTKQASKQARRSINNRTRRRRQRAQERTMSYRRDELGRGPGLGVLGELIPWEALTRAEEERRLYSCLLAHDR